MSSVYSGESGGECVVFSRKGENSDASDIWDDSALIDAYDRAVGNAYAKIASRHPHRLTNAETPNSDVSPTVSESNRLRHHADAIKSAKKVVKMKTSNRPVGDVNRTTKMAAKWQVGDPCRAKYNVDGLTYEAVVTHLNRQNNLCHVTFVGYANEEIVSTASLEPSHGEPTIRAQIRAATAESAGINGAQDESMASGTKRARLPYERRRSKYSSGEPDTSNVLPKSSFAGCFPSMPFPPPPPFIIDTPIAEDEALSNMLLSWYMSGYHSGYYQGLKHCKLQESSLSTNQP